MPVREELLFSRLHGCSGTTLQAMQGRTWCPAAYQARYWGVTLLILVTASRVLTIGEGVLMWTCINRSLVLVFFGAICIYCSQLQQSYHVCTIIHSLSSSYYQAINCPVFNGTSEHLSQMLKLWDSVARYSRYFRRRATVQGRPGQSQI